MPEKLKKYFKGDSIIWALFVALSILSLLAVYSSTFTLAYQYRSGHVGYYVFKHIIFIVFGFLIAYIAHLVPYRYYSRISHMFPYLCYCLLSFSDVMSTKLPAG